MQEVYYTLCNIYIISKRKKKNNQRKYEQYGIKDFKKRIVVFAIDILEFLL